MAKMIVNNLSFAYNGIPVIRDFNLHFKSGELISIVGPNGSGKSTMLKCMNGILCPQEGSILLDDQNISNFRAGQLAKKMAYVPQSESGTFPATVFDTVLLGRKPHIQWSPGKRDIDVTAEVIEKLNLSDIALKSINKLSGGQRQRVFIARALAQEPEILLLDEPTANLDLKHQLEVLKILKQLSQQGITVVIAIHDLNLALQYSDKFVLLKDGEIFAEGGKEIISNENIEQLYDIKVKILKDDGQFFIIPKN